MIPARLLADNYQPDFGINWIPPLTREQLTQLSHDKLAAYANARKYADQRAEANPVGAGWTLPSWRMVMDAWKKYPIVVILGGQRSTKSSFASRLCVWAAATIPDAEVRAYHVNETRSIEDQQRFIWDNLPHSLKTMPSKKGMYHSLQYTQKNGFTGNVCILPPLPGAKSGGAIRFGNYRQYQQDAQVTEGFKAHLIWADEEVPPKMFETLIYRTPDYHGRVLLTFTTLQGWTPLIQDILGKTKTIHKRRSSLLNIDLPIMQESLSRPGAAIFYFWTEDNPFIDTSDFLRKVRGRSRDEILARAHGVPTKSIGGAFPAFNKEVNVVPHEMLPFIKNPDYPVTRYMAIDPAGSKNWFMLWVAVDADGTWWVYREWPDYDDWALPGSGPEGKAGPAQKGSRKGIKDYVELILTSEDGEEIFERFIDPRLGAAEKQSADGAVTIISQLDDEEMTVIPAPGVDIDNGLQLISNKLAYDESKEISSVNAPHLFVSERCANFIFAMQEYTAKGGKDEATKDPIDALRYIAVSNPQFYEESDLIDPNNRTGVY
jgi:hypothetical protein